MPNGNPVVSHLNIDAFIENQNAYNKLYNGSTKLAVELVKNNYNIIGRFKLKGGKNVSEDESITQRQNREIIKQAFNDICSLTIEDIRMKIEGKKASIEYRILQAFYQYSYYIDKADLTALFKQALHGASSLRKLNALTPKLQFQTLNPFDHYKATVLSQFKVGENYTTDELLKKWNIVFIKSSLQHRFSIAKKSHTIADFTQRHFSIRRSKKTVDSIEENSYKIVSLEPTNAKTIKHKPTDGTFDLIRWMEEMGS